MMATTDQIRFRFAARKAFAAINWMTRQKPGVDLHTLLKACYFADKAHLNEHGRPIFGATYKAMPFGPVPLEIYEMAKCEPLSMADLDVDRFPWSLKGFRLFPDSNVDVDLGSFSESDRMALESGFTQSLSMNFTQRTAATHGPDWQAAQFGIMDYADMIEDSPTKAERIDTLQSNAPFLRL
jgi:hypothetical protein